MTVREKGGYSAGGRTASELPNPPAPLVRMTVTPSCPVTILLTSGREIHAVRYVVAPDVVAATIVSIELVGEMLAQ